MPPSSSDAWRALVPLFSSPAFQGALFAEIGCSKAGSHCCEVRSEWCERLEALRTLRAMRLVSTSWRAAVDEALPQLVGRLTPSDSRALRLLCGGGCTSKLHTLCLSRTANGLGFLSLSSPHPLSSLKTLDLSDCAWLDVPCLDALLKSSPGLLSLSLARCTNPTLANAMMLYRIAPQLTSLDLACSFVAHNLPALYTLLPLLSSCKKLNLASFLEVSERCDGATHHALRELAEHRKLTILDLSNCGDAFEDNDHEEAMGLSWALWPLLGVLVELYMTFYPYHETTVPGFDEVLMFSYLPEGDTDSMMSQTTVRDLLSDIETSEIIEAFQPPHVRWCELHQQLRQPDCDSEDSVFNTSRTDSILLFLGATVGVAMRCHAVHDMRYSSVHGVPVRAISYYISTVQLERRVFGPAQLGFATLWSPLTRMQLIKLPRRFEWVHARNSMVYAVRACFARGGDAQPLRVFTVLHKNDVPPSGSLEEVPIRPAIAAAREVEAGLRAHMLGFPGDTDTYWAKMEFDVVSPICVCCPPGDAVMEPPWGRDEGSLQNLRKPHSIDSQQLMLDRLMAMQEGNPTGVAVPDWVRPGDLCRAWRIQCRCHHYVPHG